MKDYVKKQWSGNKNGWHEPVKEVSTHRITDAQAEELNKSFGSTGTKYEPIEGKAEKKEEAEATETAAEAKPKKVRPSRAKVK